MIKLPEIFREHMVLQRNKNVLVWGKTDKKYAMVFINDKKALAVCKDGTFEAELPPMTAGGPYILKVVCGNSLFEGKLLDSESIIVGDVMIGEVWFACGQSNMELELQNSYDGQNVVKNVNSKNVRFYYTPKFAYEGPELEELKKEAEWQIATKEYANPTGVGRLSAVGFYFAKNLAEKLGCTVGIINCNWGGTHAYCWMGREALFANKNIAHIIEDYDKLVSSQTPEEYDKEYADYVVYQAEFDRKCGEYYATHEHPSWDECIELCGENKYPGPVGPKAFVRPTGLYDVMMKQFIPYTIAGAIYYQGEDDDQAPEIYFDLMYSMIRQWREDFRDDSLPVILTMLPMFKNECDVDTKNWPLMREAQLRVADFLKNVDTAVITDLGEVNNIHPLHKEPVGKRLAYLALANVYSAATPAEAYGPSYNSYEIIDDKVKLNFKNAEKGIILYTPKDNKLPDSTGYSSFLTESDDVKECFEIAGIDKKYYTADKFEITENAIVVSSEKVKEPTYVRYNWGNFQKVMLYGTNGIPVAPFRTSFNDGSSEWKSDEERTEMRFGQAI